MTKEEIRVLPTELRLQIIEAIVLEGLVGKVEELEKRLGLTEDWVETIHDLTTTENGEEFLEDLQPAEENVSPIEILKAEETPQQVNDIVDSVLQGAIEEYLKEFPTGDQPSVALSTAETDKGKDYYVLRNVNGILAVYRFEPEGFFKRLKKWPKAIRFGDDERRYINGDDK